MIITKDNYIKEIEKQSGEIQLFIRKVINLPDNIQKEVINFTDFLTIKYDLATVQSENPPVSEEQKAILLERLEMIETQNETGEDADVVIRKLAKKYNININI